MLDWIKIDTRLRRKEKVVDLCELWDMSRSQVIGLLVSLWSWAADTSDDGTVKLTRMVARDELDWDGDLGRLVSDLCDVGWLDDLGNGKHYVHGWEEHQGALLQAKEKHRLTVEKSRLKAKAEIGTLQYEVNELRSESPDSPARVTTPSPDSPTRVTPPPTDNHVTGTTPICDGDERLTQPSPDADETITKDSCDNHETVTRPSCECLEKSREEKSRGELLTPQGGTAECAGEELSFEERTDTFLPRKRAKIPKPEKQTHGQFGRVRLTSEELAKLMNKHGPQRTTLIIDKLDAHKEARGATYKSDYAAILNWVERAVAEEEARRNGGNGHASRSLVEHMSRFLGGPGE